MATSLGLDASRATEDLCWFVWSALSDVEWLPAVWCDSPEPRHLSMSDWTSRTSSDLGLRNVGPTNPCSGSLVFYFVGFIKFSKKAAKKVLINKFWNETKAQIINTILSGDCLVLSFRNRFLALCLCPKILKAAQVAKTFLDTVYIFLWSFQMINTTNNTNGLRHILGEFMPCIWSNSAQQGGTRCLLWCQSLEISL